MRLNRTKFVAVAALAIGLCGCGVGGGYDAAVAQTSANPPQVDSPPVIGDAYSIGGKRYEPKDNAAFDQVGYARVFSEEKRGTGTPNGETINPDLIEAAHQTLPMPSYVEVTHLETGKTILVRINNRGPMTQQAVIELSPLAASELGIVGGTAAVRVRRVNPPLPERAALRSGRPVPARLDTPPSLLSALRRQMKDEGVPADKGAPPVEVAMADKPMVKPAPKKVMARPAPKLSNAPGADFGVGGAPATNETVTETNSVSDMPEDTNVSQPSSSGAWYVQIGAFSSQSRAQAYAKKAGGSTVMRAGNVWRVRAGPYASEDAARGAAGQWQRKGYPGARASR